MIMLCRVFVGSVLEYDSVCYSGMARTHTLRLEKVQCSTPDNSMGVLSGIAPLAERFVYLNLRYLVVVFYCLDHPLMRRPWGS
jgi:hypothetical protein